MKAIRTTRIVQTVEQLRSRVVEAVVARHGEHVRKIAILEAERLVTKPLTITVETPPMKFAWGKDA